MATVNVSSNAGLVSALASVNPGDTIRLAAGNYGTLDLSGAYKDAHLNFSGEVTITSADASNPAVFKGLDIQSVSNITFDNIIFDFDTTTSTDLSARPFTVDGSENIIIRNSVFEGDDFKGSDTDSRGFGAGFGLRVLRSSDVAIEDNEFTNFYIAANFADVENLLVSGNEVHGVSGDALKFSAIDNAVIENNHVHDFRANPDNGFHRDMIQILNMNTDTSRDVTIRGNILDSGEGNWTQSIFIGNEAVRLQGAGQSMYYQNFEISNNLIYNAQANAIAVGATNGLVVSNNTVLHNTGSGISNAPIPRINIADQSRSVRVEDNITHEILAPSGATVRGNLIVQDHDPLGANYYGDLFVGALAPSAEIEALQALPGGTVESLGVGADITRFDRRPDDLTALATHELDRGTHVFDASLSADAGGYTGSGADYRWDFGDGSSGRGQIVSHSYDAPGDYTVTLRVTDGGRTDSFSLNVESTDPRLLALRISNGTIDDISAFDASVTQGGTNVNQSGSILTLTDNNYFTVNRSDIEQLHALDEFALSFDMRRATSSDNSSGIIFDLRNSWRVSLDDGGHIVLELTSAAGRDYTLTSSSTITDTSWHEVLVHFDGEDRVASIEIDGRSAGSIAVAGTTQSAGPWGLTVGHATTTTFNGNLRNIDIYESAEAIGYEAPDSGNDTAPTDPAPAEPDTDPDDGDDSGGSTGSGGDLVINAGSGSDAYFSGGNAYTQSDAIAGTGQDAFYQSTRQGDFSYDIGLDNGSYEVTLHFAEPRYNYAGNRSFDVRAEGNLVLDNFDIAEEAGGRDTAHDETFTVQVSGGNLDLDFRGVDGSAASLAGISVTGADGSSSDGSSGGDSGGSSGGSTGSGGDLVINAGSGSDAYFTGGDAYTQSDAIAGTGQDAFYQSTRQGDFSYDIGLDNGSYEVTLHFAEPRYNYAGNRSFDVRAEGNLVLDNFDIAEEAGGRDTAHDETFTVQVSGGNLDLDFRGVDGSAASLAGISVTGADGSSSGGSSGGDSGGSSGDFSLMAARWSSRGGASELEGQTLSENAYIFIEGGEDADTVRFYLDDEDMSGAAFSTDTEHYHDLAGTRLGTNGYALPWDTTDERDGSHTITAEVTAFDGSVTVLSDSFLIDNI